MSEIRVDNTYNFEEKCSFEEMINIWKMLFPEIKNDDEFLELLETCSQFNLEMLKNVYVSGIHNNEFNRFRMEICDKELEEEFNNILDEIREEFRWVDFYKPIFNYYIESLNKFLNSRHNLCNSKELLKDIVWYMVSNLHVISFRTLIYDINEARENNMLRGSTSKERADYYRNVLLRNEDYLKKMYGEYNELVRLMNINIFNTVEYVKSIILNTENNFEEICKTLDIDKSEKIKTISLSEGDTHEEGKTVCILHMESGKKIIYKPRALDIDFKYCKFIEWINNQSIEGFLDLKAPRVYFVKDAGWVEFIENYGCKSMDDIKAFYKRSGQLLSIMYALNSKDFHMENVIAHGEYPVLIDLETLLHPNLFEDEKEFTEAFHMAKKVIDKSVIPIGFLPMQIINSKNKKNIDLGGLTAEENQESSMKSSFIKDYENDNVRVVRQYSIIETSKNNPKIDDNTVKSQEFIDEIIIGFKNTYMWILNNKEVFIKKVKEYFSNTVCRLIFRPTMHYGQLLSTSYHPDLLRDTLDRKIYLHRIAIRAEKKFKEFVVAEYLDLFNGDIPFFTANTGSLEVVACGNKKISGVFKKTIIDTIVDKIRSVSLEDLERQVSFIRMSYMNKLKNINREETNIKFDNCISKGDINKEQCLKLACDLGNHVINKSISGIQNGSIDRTWIGSMEIGDILVVNPVGNNFYSGNSGIAIFLASLAMVSGNKDYGKVALEALESGKEYINELEKHGSNDEDDDLNIENKIGAFNGVAGLLYSMYNVGKMLNNNELLAFSKSKVSLIDSMITDTKDYDVISGLVGALGVLISMYEKDDDDEFRGYLLEICNNIFNKLKEITISKEGVKGLIINEQGYVGFSHGNAGASAFLIKLYKFTKNNEVLELVKSLLEYERSMYDNKGGNWYRSLEEKYSSCNWCHGAPGILLSRVMLLKYGYSDDFILYEIENAIETVKNNGFGRDFCMCHGDLGNLRILSYAAKALDNKELEEKCLMNLKAFIEAFVTKYLNDNKHKERESYGLMVGYSGLGYGILQYLNDNIPEILLLESIK